MLVLQDNGINESLAMADVAGVLRASGHRVHLLLGDEERGIGLQIRAFDPDLVLIPCPVAGHERALLDARRARRAAPRSLVLLLGTYATLDPERVLTSDVDAVCIGEAEEALATLAHRLSRGEPWHDVPNLVRRVGGQVLRNPLAPAVALDALPPPDRGLYFRYPFLAALPWKKFATGRGCIHTCTFCWNTQVKAMYRGRGAFVRRKTPQRVVEEILDVQARGPLRRVHFSDDLFTVHPGWLAEFAPLYRARVGLPFTCNSSAPLLTKEVVSLLSQAGCLGVAFGIETGNEALRAKVLGKPISNDEIRRTATLLHDAGLAVTTFNMVGSPGETADDVLDTIELNQEIRADHLRVNLAIPLPHTGFEATAYAWGSRAEGPLAFEVKSLTDATLPGAHPEAHDLVNLYLLFRPAVHGRWGRRTTRLLASGPDLRRLRFLQLWGLWEEKQITGLSWWEGARFHRHVGDPRKRTANYVTLP